MKKCIKRIMNIDIRRLKESKLDEQGIYIEFDENDITTANVMVVGPKDSLYEGGYLFFTVKFPSNYPFSPPHVKYHSNSNVRIHPNIYVNGKVCLSILGTWSGPSWTTIMDISSVLISIQSLLDMNPLDHEPGFANKKSNVHELYSQCVLYETYRTLIIKNIFDIPTCYLCFKDIIEGHYKDNRDEIISSLNEILYEKSLQKELYVPIYRIHIKQNYTELKNKLKKLENLI